MLIAGNTDGGVERGVILLGSPCDPLTTGWVATGGAERFGKALKRRLPAISC
jgi:N-acetylated-alpha-linked acidic dipeptidase